MTRQQDGRQDKTRLKKNPPPPPPGQHKTIQTRQDQDTHDRKTWQAKNNNNTRRKNRKNVDNIKHETNTYKK